MSFKDKLNKLSGWTRLVIVLCLAWVFIAPFICLSVEFCCDTEVYLYILTGWIVIWAIYGSTMWVIHGFKSNHVVNNISNKENEGAINTVQKELNGSNHAKKTALEYRAKIMGTELENEKIESIFENTKSNRYPTQLIIFLILVLFAIFYPVYFGVYPFEPIFYVISGTALFFPTWIWSVIIASRTNAYWSIGCMLAYLIVFPIFAFIHWDRAKYALIAFLLSALFIGGGGYFGGVWSNNIG